MIGALIGAGASLLGGALNRRENRRQAARQEYLRSPAGIRAESEKAGFNPLTVLQSGRDFAADLYRPVIGDALANAGFHVSDAMQKEKMRQTELQMHNENLQARLKALSLKPVPNQYGRTTGTAGSNQPIGGSGETGPYVTASGHATQGVTPDAGQDLQETILVRSATGNQMISVDRRAAEEMGVRPGDTLTMEQMEPLTGDALGDAIAITNMNSLSRTQTGIWAPGHIGIPEQSVFNGHKGHGKGPGDGSWVQFKGTPSAYARADQRARARRTDIINGSTVNWSSGTGGRIFEMPSLYPQF